MVETVAESSGDEKLGVACIQACVASLDGSPGVYRMLDSRGQVLYVGKARNLKNRVRSYTTLAGQNARIAKVINSTASMMFLTTRTETEALLLEQNLIKQLKPKYNVLLRDDKSFPSILVSGTHKFPQIKKHRGARSEKGNYFGPFASAEAVGRTLSQLQKAFLLRNCSDSTFSNRNRPCLLYQIKRCSAPCVGHISEEAYGLLVKHAEEFLSGKSIRMQEQLAEEMSGASARLDFERAAVLRDRIKALTQVQTIQGVNPRLIKDADVIGLHQEGGQACVQVFFIRGHQNWGNHAYFPRTGSGAENHEILQAFLGQFYSNKTPPRFIIISDPVEDHELMEDVLTERRGTSVKILVPARGEKALLVENAVRNASEALAMKVAEIASHARLLEGLARLAGMAQPPNRVEVYDNSHIQGKNSVGAMIVVGPEGFVRHGYRKFNFRRPSLSPGDDFAMMREVLNRRFRRLQKEDPDRLTGEWPDLVIVDGGKGQLGQITGVFEELGIADVAVMGVSKGPNRNAGDERIHLPGTGARVLQSKDPVLYFIQRIRDEAHRFAIGAHRAKRSKSMSATALSEIPGVGATRKSALLSHFGSAAAVGRAGVNDLKAVSGISKALARTIYDYFHDQQG